MALLHEMGFARGSVIYDPCAGQGNILEAARRSGLRAVGTDIARRWTVEPWWWSGFRDFPNFGAPEGLRFDAIVMNPPFARGIMTELFIRRALGIARVVAAFVEMRFLFGSTRARRLFQLEPPQRVSLLCPRPSCPPGEALRAGQRAQGGRQDFVWMIWDRRPPSCGGPPSPATRLSWTIWK